MRTAIIKSTKNFDFPYVVHVYNEAGDLLEGHFFASIIKVQAYILGEGIDKFIPAL